MSFLNVSTFMQGILALGSAAAVLTALMPPGAVNKGSFIVGNGSEMVAQSLPNGKILIGDNAAASGVSAIDLPGSAFDFAYANVGGPHDYVMHANETRLMFAPQTDLVTLPAGSTMTHDIDAKVQSNGLPITFQSPDDSIDGPGLTSFVIAPGGEVTIAHNATQHWFVRK